MKPQSATAARRPICSHGDPCLCDEEPEDVPVGCTCACWANHPSFPEVCDGSKDSPGGFCWACERQPVEYLVATGDGETGP